MLETDHAVGPAAAREPRSAGKSDADAAYRYLADHSADLIVRESFESGRTYASPASFALLGYTPQELVAMPLTAIVHPDDFAAHHHLFEALRRGEVEQGRLTHRTRHRADRWIWVEAKYRLVRDASGAPAEIVVAVRDVGERVAAVEALRAEEARLRALADALPQMIWTFSSTDGAATYTNDRFRQYYGSIDGARSTRVGLNHPDDAERMAAAWTAAVAADRGYSIEGRLRRCDGAYRWHKLVVTPIHHADNSIEWLATALDIDDLMSARDDLADTSMLLRLAQESADAGLWDWDMETGVVRHSATSARMHGIPVPDTCRDGTIELTLADWEACVCPEDVPGVFAQVQRALDTGTTYDGLFRIPPKHDGESMRWLQAYGKIVPDPRTGKPRRFVGLHFDVTARRAAEARSLHLALHDPLTGLPNRTHFHDDLDRRIASATTTGASFAVLAIDLDRFKPVNDTFGHPAGDAMLKEVGRRLQESLGTADMVARLGGDEFVVLLADVADNAVAARTAERLIARIGMPLDLDGRSLVIGASIGIAIAPRDGSEADDLFRKADIALFEAKDGGRGTCRFYEAGVEAAIADRNLLSLDMRDALRDGAFSLDYQPIIDTRDGGVTCCEALMRWTHPVRGAISPDMFIPLAEENGTIVPLGAWAIRHACREAAAWPCTSRVAVNVSAVQFTQAGLEQVVLEALASSGLSPDRLELEITESVLLSDNSAAVDTLHALRKLGVRIALDDFGTGYSSLAYLRKFPFSKIKIDRSFIRGIGDPQTAAIVRAIVGLGHSLGITITAEGVETGAERDRVVAEGCREIQGYLYSRPLASAALRGYLDARQAGVVARRTKRNAAAA